MGNARQDSVGLVEVTGFGIAAGEGLVLRVGAIAGYGLTLELPIIDEAAKEVGQEDNYVVGANIAGFKIIYDAMSKKGLL